MCTWHCLYNMVFSENCVFHELTVWLRLCSVFQWTVFWPQQVPYDNLGPLGTLSRYLVDNYHSLMYKG